MTTMLILVVLKAGEIVGVFLGDYEYPNACREALSHLAEMASLGIGPAEFLELVKDSDAATLMCIPRPEA